MQHSCAPGEPFRLADRLVNAISWRFYLVSWWWEVWFGLTFRDSNPVYGDNVVIMGVAHFLVTDRVRFLNPHCGSVSVPGL